MTAVPRAGAADSPALAGRTRLAEAMCYRCVTDVLPTCYRRVTDTGGGRSAEWVGGRRAEGRARLWLPGAKRLHLGGICSFLRAAGGTWSLVLGTHSPAILPGWPQASTSLRDFVRAETLVLTYPRAPLGLWGLLPAPAGDMRSGPPSVLASGHRGVCARHISTRDKCMEHLASAEHLLLRGPGWGRVSPGTPSVGQGVPRTPHSVQPGCAPPRPPRDPGVCVRGRALQACWAPGCAPGRSFAQGFLRRARSSWHSPAGLREETPSLGFQAPGSAPCAAARAGKNTCLSPRCRGLCSEPCAAEPAPVSGSLCTWSGCSAGPGEHLAGKKGREREAAPTPQPQNPQKVCIPVSSPRHPCC